jgi:hypothetical protein
VPPVPPVPAAPAAPAVPAVPGSPVEDDERPAVDAPLPARRRRRK